MVVDYVPFIISSMLSMSGSSQDHVQTLPHTACCSCDEKTKKQKVMILRLQGLHSIESVLLNINIHDSSRPSGVMGCYPFFCQITCGRIMQIMHKVEGLCYVD